MQIKTAIVVFVSMALSACATVKQPRFDSLQQLGDHLARSICAGANTELKPVANLHVPGQIDRLETRRCSSGSSTLYVGKSTSNPAGLAVNVEVVAPKAGLPPHLEIGQPIELAIKTLGSPQQQGGGSVTYGLGLRPNDTATILHEVGRITAVQWVWVLD